MIHHWKALDLEITDSEYHHDLTSSYETIPSQTTPIDGTIQKNFYKIKFSFLCTPIDM